MHDRRAHKSPAKLAAMPFTVTAPLSRLDQQTVGPTNRPRSSNASTLRRGIATDNVQPSYPASICLRCCCDCLDGSVLPRKVIAVPQDVPHATESAVAKLPLDVAKTRPRRTPSPEANEAATVVTMSLEAEEVVDRTRHLSVSCSVASEGGVQNYVIAFFTHHQTNLCGVEEYYPSTDSCCRLVLVGARQYPNPYANGS